jgi:hypothetical protein
LGLPEVGFFVPREAGRFRSSGPNPNEPDIAKGRFFLFFSWYSTHAGRLQGRADAVRDPCDGSAANRKCMSCQ